MHLPWDRSSCELRTVMYCSEKVSARILCSKSIVAISFPFSAKNEIFHFSGNLLPPSKKISASGLALYSLVKHHQYAIALFARLRAELIIDSIDVPLSHRIKQPHFGPKPSKDTCQRGQYLRLSQLHPYADSSATAKANQERYQSLAGSLQRKPAFRLELEMIYELV